MDTDFWPGTHYPHVKWAYVMLTRAVGM